MMQFKIVGKLSAMKNTENFHPYDDKIFEGSGWEIIRYRFNVLSGTNRIACEISGGKWADDTKNRILTFTKSTKDDKGSPIEINWADRRDESIIDKVAGYRVYNCKLAAYDDKINDNRFLERTEFAQFVKDTIDGGQYANQKFEIVGNVDFQYSAKDDTYYRTFQVNKIYFAKEDAEDKAEVTVDTYYTAKAIEENVFHCYTESYFSNVKKKCFVPLALVFHSNGSEKEDKIVNAFKTKLSAFNDEATVRRVSLVCSVIDGSEAVAITYNDLDDETKELIDLGLIDESEAIKGLGGTMFGDRKTEMRIKAFGKASAKGTEPTIYTADDLKAKPIVEAVEDLFDEEEEL